MKNNYPSDSLKLQTINRKNKIDYSLEKENKENCKNVPNFIAEFFQDLVALPQFLD